MKNIKLQFAVLIISVLFSIPSTHAFAGVPDTTPPVLTLNGAVAMTINAGDIYTDLGATAVDDIDGDITPNINIYDNVFDTTILGDHVVTYKVVDSSGNSSFITRTVTVVPIIPPPPTSTVKLLIRIGDTIIYQDKIDLPPAGTVTVTDDTGIDHAVDADSVLGLLSIVDKNSDAFSLSDLKYYDSFGAFYLKCILPTAGENTCDNWQYSIEGTIPWQSIDTATISDGQHIGIYFGSPYKIILDPATITTTGSTTVTAEQYDYQTNTWSVRTGVTIGVTQPDPNNPWSPTEIQTSVVDANGQTIFNGLAEGSYNVGVQNDYYLPTET